jgi:hypothetical protein
MATFKGRRLAEQERSDITIQLSKWAVERVKKRFEERGKAAYFICTIGHFKQGEEFSRGIRQALLDKEHELGIESELDIEIKQESLGLAGGTTAEEFFIAIIIVASSAFITGFAKRFGEDLADWLCRKLGINKRI